MPLVPSCISSGRLSDSSAALSAAFSTLRVAKLVPVDTRSDGRRRGRMDGDKVGLAVAGTSTGEEEAGGEMEKD